MLLHQWRTEVVGVEVRSTISLRDVSYFAFGETYYVRLLDGRTLQDNDLERLLDMMRDEFLAHNTTVTLHGDSAKLGPHILLEGVVTRNDPLGQRSKVEMHIQPRAYTGNDAPPMCDDEFIAKVYQMVTAYNLTGQWTQFAKENL